ncbi:MAG: hypothetical protein ACR2MD_05050 [Aridibacter sp.]
MDIKIKKIMRVLSLVWCLLLISATNNFAQEKKNSRPTEDNLSKVSKIEADKPVYFYEFAKDEFLVKRIFIEHDENGIGKITFLKKDFNEEISEPLKLSDVTLEKLKTFWTEINFLESDENYQSTIRDYGHLGTIKLRMERDAKKRAAEFNWTENLTAKALADEYRKISNQFVWMFDINVARQNQPLESPKIMRTLDSYLSRNSISDPVQMLPFLKELSEDERIPLIARNHAERLIKQIEKDKKKNEGKTITAKKESLEKGQ